MFSRCCLILTLTLLLAGCNSQQSRESLLLPMPDEAGVTGSFNQLMRINYGDSEQILLASLEVAADHLTVVILHPSGIRLMSAEYNGERIHQRQLPMPGVEITAEQVLRDIMLAYWPRQSWQPYLSQQELRMEDDGVERLISNHDGKLVYRIKYHGDNSQRWYSSLSLEQLQLNYHLVITPIDEQQ